MYIITFTMGNSFFSVLNIECNFLNVWMYLHNLYRGKLIHYIGYLDVGDEQEDSVREMFEDNNWTIITRDTLDEIE